MKTCKGVRGKFYDFKVFKRTSSINGCTLSQLVTIVVTLFFFKIASIGTLLVSAVKCLFLWDTNFDLCETKTMPFTLEVHKNHHVE